MNLLKLIFTLSTILTPLILHGQSQALLQNTYNRNTIALDGLWQAIIDPMENGFYRSNLQPRGPGKSYYDDKKMENSYDLIEYNFDSGQQLLVPGDWNTQMEKLYYYEGTVWYRRLFSYSSEADKTVILRFNAVNYKCKVFLNGELLGEHVGGFTPFEFDVTGQLKQSNSLVLMVNNSRNRSDVPTINFDWWNYGGITRSVELVELPATYISDYTFSLGEDRETIKGEVQVHGMNVEGKTVQVAIPEINKSVSVTTNFSGKAIFNIKAKIQCWSPSNPKLYEVKLSVGGDKLFDQIGFKTIDANNNQILLNDKPIFLKGISIHEQAPYGNGRVTSVEQCRILLQWAKDLGCNFLRFAHYPHNEAMVREAEKMGFLIWSEIPVYWAIDYENNQTYQNAENMLLDMIRRDKNRVGIAMWSVANETPSTDSRLAFLRSLIDQARRLDPTRLITAALHTQKTKGGLITIEDPLGDYIDVIGINNYCGWYNNRPNVDFCRDLVWKNNFKKPMIMSEMGGGALYGLRGEKNEIWTEDFQANVYNCNIEMLKNIPFLAGTSPWILMDFRSPRRNLYKIQQNYNRKGLISEEGGKKLAFYVLKEFYNIWDGFWEK